MAKDKRSFFERLTGAVSVDEEENGGGNRAMELAIETKENNWTEDEESGELPVDVYQTSEDIYIKAMVSGVKPEDLDISITRDMVTIKGIREGSREVNEENYFFKELFWGSFARTILLPQEIEVEESEATERNGMLTIKLPKVDKGKQTKLKVKTS